MAGRWSSSQQTLLNSNYSSDVRSYVGVICFVSFSCCSNSYRLRFKQRNLCFISKMYDEALAKFGFRIGRLMIQLWLLNPVSRCSLFKHSDVRQYVGVICFVSHVSPTPTDYDSNDGTCVSLTKSTMKHRQNLDSKSDL